MIQPLYWNLFLLHLMFWTMSWVDNVHHIWAIEVYKWTMIKGIVEVSTRVILIHPRNGIYGGNLVQYCYSGIKRNNLAVCRWFFLNGTHSQPSTVMLPQEVTKSYAMKKKITTLVVNVKQEETPDICVGIFAGKRCIMFNKIHNFCC